jgi:hypothetical protein
MKYLRSPATTVAVVGLAATITLASPARADGAAATCRKLRAEARSQAALLYAPRLTASLVHLPPGGALDPAQASFGDGDQVRGSIALSPVDAWRGHLVLRTADAECRRVAATLRLEPVLREGVEFGRAAALRAQIDFLTAALPRVGELVADAEARLARQILTAAEVDELRDRRHELRRQLIEARHELALLEEEAFDRELEPGSPTTAADLAAGVAAYERASLAAERAHSALRRVSPWQVDLRLGVVPSDGTQWFGVVEVSYSLGDLWQRKAERAYLDARTDELRDADAELHVRTERFTHAMARSAAGLGDELALVDEELARLDAERARLDALDGDRAQEQRIRAELDGILLGARRTYLSRLLSARTRVADGGREP